MAKRRGRKKLTVVGPHLGHKEMKHKGGHKGRGQQAGSPEVMGSSPMPSPQQPPQGAPSPQGGALLLW